MKKSSKKPVAVLLCAVAAVLIGLVAYDGVKLVYEKDALEAVADKAIEMKIGARGLRSVMEGIMTDIMYTVPSEHDIEKVIVTADCVKNGTGPDVIRK